MMTLPRGQRAIIAGFQTMKDAQKAETELKQLGLETSIERTSLYPAEQYERQPQNPISGDYPGLAEGTFDTDLNRDESILANASPSASGMSDGNDENIGMDVVLTTLANEKQANQAEKIVQKYGGSI